MNPTRQISDMPGWRRRVPPAIFLGLMGILLVLSRQAGLEADVSGSREGPAAAGQDMSHGFSLAEVSAEAGIDFLHVAPHFDAKLEHIMPQVASMGAGVSVADFDRDGWIDVYVTNSGEGSHNHLYRNLGGGRFEEVAEAMGVADLNAEGTGVSMAALWGDYDNDGYPDLLVTKWGRPELFRNLGGSGFERVTEDSGLPEWVNATSAVWLDYDRDGRLDIFLGGYYDETVDLWNLATTKMMPESFDR